MQPVLVAQKLPSGEWHDGYAVRKLGFRGAHGDREEQRSIGPDTIDQINDMSADDYQDVIVHATEEQIDHKLAENVPDDHMCYWQVSGKPRQTRFGQRIWFENGGRIVATGGIYGVETDRIWFYPLESVDLDVPVDVPSQGFKYVDQDLIDVPEEATADA
jgi:hypothetical protein